MKEIKITRSHHSLKISIWRFMYNQVANRIVLKKYITMERDDRSQDYEVIDPRTKIYHIDRPEEECDLTEEEVPLPEDVKKEALDHVVNQIKVCTKSEIEQ